MNRKPFHIIAKHARRILAAVITASSLLSLSACSGKPVEGSIPVVSYVNNEICINGEFYARSEHLSINRIDSRVLSMTTDDGYINLDAEGNEIKLSDVIPNRLMYESTIKQTIGSKIMMRSAPLSVDKDAMMKEVCSYDKAMKLPFILGPNGVGIIYKDSDGDHLEAASYKYDSGIVDLKYAPGDGIKCSSWMTGRIGYGIPELKFKEYKDHWAESSLEIDDYEGRDYIWFCIRYEDEDGNKTYYSVVVEKNDENGKTKYKMISAEKTDGRFVCCNIETFSGIISNVSI